MSMRGGVYTLFVLSACLVTHAYSLETLYPFSEPIVQLHVSNFTSTIANKTNAWVVEFYASWCGHCQRLAPIWTQFSRDVAGWHQVVNVAAIACSDPVNSPICRFYNIYGYPKLKFFPPFTTRTYRGMDFRTQKTVAGLRRGTVDYLQTLHSRPTTWPGFAPYRELGALRQRSATGDVVFVLFVDPHDPRSDPYLSTELILDMSGFEKVVVARMERYEGERLGVGVFPSLHLLRPDGSLTQIAQSLDRKGFREVLHGSLREMADGEDIMDELDGASLPEPTTTHRSIGNVVTPNGLHMADLESFLYYNLYLEVGQHNVIREDAVAALKAHVQVLAKYFPGNDYTRLFLNKTNSWLQTVRWELAGEEFIEQLDRLQRVNAYVPKRISWVGCRPSQPRFRGYPCSVWMTYHAMTVKAFLKNRHDPSWNKLEVLQAMREYVRYFLGCRECAGHFVAMAQNLEKEVTNITESVLWLWRAHNRVNARLADDETEDPVHPKVQFPSPYACPGCADSREPQLLWDEEDVFRYLMWFYGPAYVIQDGVSYIYTGRPVDVTRPTIPREVPETTTPPIRQPLGHHPRPPLPMPARSAHWTPAGVPTEEEASIRTRPTPAGTPHPVYIPTSRPAWNPQQSQLLHTASPHHKTTPVPRLDSTTVVQAMPLESSANSSCTVRHSEWSPCSVTCDIGFSSRMSNDNPQCEMKLDIRICRDRPCKVSFINARSTTSMCGATYQSSSPMPMVFNDCLSTHAYRWRYCGHCENKCCHPVTSDTFLMPFVCAGRFIGNAKVHWIYYCRCDDHCSN